MPPLVHHASNLRNGHAPFHPDRHGRWLAPTSPATSYHLLVRGKPHPESSVWCPPAAPDGHGTPAPRGTRTSDWSHTPQRTGHDCHPRYLDALVSSPHRAEV